LTNNYKNAGDYAKIANCAGDGPETAQNSCCPTSRRLEEQTELRQGLPYKLEIILLVKTYFL
jgi:hypothetical protein